MKYIPERSNAFEGGYDTRSYFSHVSTSQEPFHVIQKRWPAIREVICHKVLEGRCDLDGDGTAWTSRKKGKNVGF